MLDNWIWFTEYLDRRKTSRIEVDYDMTKSKLFKVISFFLIISYENIPGSFIFKQG